MFADLGSGLGLMHVYSSQDAVHEPAHRPDSGAVHETAVGGGYAPGVGKGVAYRAPVNAECVVDAVDVGIPGGEVAVRIEAAGGRGVALLEHLNDAVVGNHGSGAVFLAGRGAFDHSVE